MTTAFSVSVAPSLTSENLLFDIIGLYYSFMEVLRVDFSAFLSRFLNLIASAMTSYISLGSLMFCILSRLLYVSMQYCCDGRRLSLTV